MDQKLNKIYVAILNVLIQREVIHPTLKYDEWDPSMDWSLDSCDFGIEGSLFESFLLSLENQKIIKCTHGAHVPEFVGKENKVAHDEDGNVINSDEYIMFYHVLNLEKAKKYRNNLENFLSPDDLGSIHEVSRISTEPKRKEVGCLNQRHSGIICYKDTILDLRVGLKGLLELFMERPNQLINKDDIKDVLGSKSVDLQPSTISKYVAEINKTLKPHFNRNPIQNKSKEGWVFHP